MPTQFASLSNNRKLYFGSAALLLLTSFAPWYHVSALGVSVSLNGWHQLGSFAWLLLIGLLIFEGARASGFIPVRGRIGDLYASLGALTVVAVGTVFVIQRLTDGSIGFGLVLGIIWLAALGYSSVTSFRENGGADAVRAELDARRK